jgi:hypothetical protein
MHVRRSRYLQFTGLGLLGPALMANLGGDLGRFAGDGLIDPRMRAMSSVSDLLASTGPDGIAFAGADAEMRQTVHVAMANAAKGTIAQLRKHAK